MVQVEGRTEANEEMGRSEGWIAAEVSPFTGWIFERPLAIRQSATVRDYRQWFETLVSWLNGVSEVVLEYCFLNGLRPEIRAEVHQLRPSGLEQIFKGPNDGGWKS